MKHLTKKLSIAVLAAFLFTTVPVAAQTDNNNTVRTVEERDDDDDNDNWGLAGLLGLLGLIGLKGKDNDRRTTGKYNTADRV